MLHPDSEKRILEMIKVATIFEELGCFRTGERIRSFINILDEKEIPGDYPNELESLFALFHKEFEERLPVGKNFRKRVFQEIVETVLGSIKRMGFSAFHHALLIIYPIMQKLTKVRKITREIAEELGRNGISDKNVVFHLRCYTYLIIVEGMCDELARILYFLKIISPGEVPNLNDLETMTIWNILNRSESIPVFLENWEVKNHIRNAIGHARVNYDSTKDEVQFIDINMRDGTEWDSGIIPLKEFYKMALELEDSIAAFSHTFMLLRINDLIVSKNPYQ